MEKHTDCLGDRMKAYEAVPKLKLINRLPVIIRIDGKAFHTFTKGCAKPFDAQLQYCMIQTTTELCSNIQNCVLGYTQSDEITLVLLDDFKLNTDPYFGNQVEKICSVAASIATRAFNKAVYGVVKALELRNKESEAEQLLFWKSRMFKAEFDARCFNVPNRTEVYNNLVWRQQDCIKNSITLLSLAHFSNKEIQGKNGKDKITMLEEKGIRWNELHNIDKQGIVIYKESYKKDESIRTRWVPDWNTPVFTQEPGYILSLLGEAEE